MVERNIDVVDAVGSSPSPPTSKSMIIDGKAISQRVLDKVQSNLLGKPLTIAAVWVGEDPSIGRFVEMKEKRAASIGIKMETYHFESTTSESVVIDQMKKLAEDESIKGIIVELPMPEGFDQDRILNIVPVNKDIDVLSTEAQREFYQDRSKVLPPAVEALKMLVEECHLDLKEKTAVVFGRSILIGKPITHWLTSRSKKVLIIDEDTKDADKICREADIVVSGVGKPGLINAAMIKEGAVVVDFGFEKLGDKVSGDVDFDSVSPKASLITPVPGGMGPLGIAAFLQNAVILGSVR